MKAFSRRCEVMALWIANKMEKTVNQACDTFKILVELQDQQDQLHHDEVHKDQLHHDEVSERDISPWPSEGGHELTDTCTQLKQHLLASRHLMRQTALTEKAMLETHEILMGGSIDDEVEIVNVN